MPRMLRSIEKTLHCSGITVYMVYQLVPGGNYEVGNELPFIKAISDLVVNYSDL